MAGKPGRSGRKRKPHGMKVLEGTDKPGDEPSIEFPAPEGDQPPYFILEDEHAMREWDNLFPLLNGTRVMSQADRTQLGMLCQQYSDILMIRRNKGRPTAADISQLRAAYTEFGLTPASRGRVKPVGESKSSNKFNQLKKDA